MVPAVFQSSFWKLSREGLESRNYLLVVNRICMFQGASKAFVLII